MFRGLKGKIFFALVFLSLLSGFRYLYNFRSVSCDTPIENKFDENVMRKLMNDPMYRPLDVLKNESKFDPNSKIQKINIEDLSLGHIAVEYDLNGGVGNRFLTLNGNPIFGNGDFIDLVAAFRISSIELLFFVTQSPGTCCYRFKSVYLLRSINNFGYGIEDVGAIYNGVDDEKTLKERFQISGKQILINLDVHDLRLQFVKVVPEGGVQKFSKEIEFVPVIDAYCDFLWREIEDYLKEVNLNPDAKDSFDKFLESGSNYQRQMHNEIENTQTGYHDANYKKIAERVARERMIHPELRNLFNQEVCGTSNMAP